MTIKADDNTLYGKNGATGVAVAKANLCFIVGTYNENVPKNNAFDAVQKGAQFFRDNGY